MRTSIGLADALLAGLILATGLGANPLVERHLNLSLEEIQGLRVTLLARAALAGGARPEGAGELTVVDGRDGQLRYQVHTSSTPRIGSILSLQDPLDAARARAHRAALAEKSPARQRLADGRLSVTLADGARSAQLSVRPEPIELPSDGPQRTLPVGLALLAFGLARLRLGRFGAAGLGWLMLSAGLGLSTAQRIAQGSAIATAYLSQGGLAGPAVQLPAAWIALAAALPLAACGVALAVAALVARRSPPASTDSRSGIALTTTN